MTGLGVAGLFVPAMIGAWSYRQGADRLENDFALRANALAASVARTVEEGDISELREVVALLGSQPGVESIRLPGDRSAAVSHERQEHGIPLDNGTWQQLVNLAAELGVNLPAV